MSREYYDHGYAIPDYYTTQNRSPRRLRKKQHPQGRIPRSGFAESEGMRGPPPMRTEHAGAFHGQSSRRIADPQPLPNQQYAQRNPRQPPHNLYEGSAFEYQEDYGQDGQWPLPAFPNHQSPHSNGSSPRRPPPRPLRPDEQSPARGCQQRPDQMMSRAPPHMTSPDRQSHRSPRSASLHHGSGQWTTDGYVYAPPPNYPLPSRPSQPITASPTDPLTSMVAYSGPLVPERVTLAQANRRVPLGPPPSARRGPPSYYPQVGPVHSIVEETDSMRGSVRTGSAHTGGRESKNSFASSNAIPIGISQLGHVREVAAAHQPVQRPAPLFDSEDDELEDSPTEPAVARASIRTPEPAYYEVAFNPGTTVVRQASLGKKSKPTLTTVKSSNSVRRKDADARAAIASLPSQLQDSPPLVPEETIEMEMPTPLDLETVSVDTQAGAPEPPRKSDLRPLTPVQHSSEAPQHAASPPIRDGDSLAVIAAAAYLKEAGLKQDSRRGPLRESGAGLDYPDEKSIEQGLSHMQSKESLRTVPSDPLHPQESHPRSALAPAGNPRVESILGSLEKGGVMSEEEVDGLQQPSGGLSDRRSDKRRPPRLDVDAVREAEARGSLTSLSDLIRRATKLASNLDRGKTASRLGLNWIDGAPDEEKRRSGDIGDILASFPPPAPSRNGFRKSLAGWSAKNRHSALPSDSDTGDRKQSRRCCGMPLWLFLAVLLSLILLIAAAVVVPVVLVVLPKQNEAGSTKVGSCTGTLRCENGGTNIMSSNGQCKCLCVNGFTGPTCSSWQEAGCTTISTRSSNNATVGAAIPRLLEYAETKFSIPLGTQELLGLFSSLDLNCNMQNQLVTFNSQSSKRSTSASTGTDHQKLPTRRQEFTVESDSTSETSTSTTTAVLAPSSSGSTRTNSTMLDFVRVAILYILQDSGDLVAASDAQENLQSYLRTGSVRSQQQTATAQDIALGHGYNCSLDALTVTTSNGTTVGGRGT